MALYQSDILTHNNPNLAVADGDFVKGGFRSAVASVNDLYALSGKTDEPSAAGQLKEYATIVYVTGETKYYVLKDITNVDNPAGWEEFSAGSGTITGGTNGLSTDGANIVLGGSLLSGTTINASGNTFYLTNVDEFQVSTSGSTGIIGVDNTGILLEFSGTSVSLENNAGLVYNADYRTTFIDNSLVSKKYVDTVAIGLQPKTAVWVATSTGNTGIDLTGGTFGGTIDGITIADKDRVLIKNQNGSVQDIKNGIYVYSGSSNTFYRSPDFDGTPTGEVSRGALVPVLTGATNRNTLWVLITDEPIVDTTPLSFTPFSTPGNYTEGVGIDIDITGSVISVDGSALAGDHINWDGSSFNVIPSGITSGYTTLSQFNTYTGDTETRINALELWSGATEIRINALEIWSGETQPIIDAALTGVTYIGTGEIPYSGVTGREIVFNTFLGSGDTTVQKIGDEIVIYSSSIGTITGATNGLGSIGANICLGGMLNTGTTTVTIPTYTAALNFVDGGSCLNFDSESIGISNNDGWQLTLDGGTDAIYLGKIGSSYGEFSANGIYFTNPNNGGSGIRICSGCTIICGTPVLPDVSYNTFDSIEDGILYRDDTDKLVHLVTLDTLISGITTTALTGATNGLHVIGQNVVLGGTLTGNTTINLSTFDLKFSGDSLQYTADYSGSYTARSIPDVDFVTGYTQSTVTQSLNTVNVCIVCSNYSATTINDFIGVSGNTSYCIWLPPSPKPGQRISVADICVDALTYPICIFGTGGRSINGNGYVTINTEYGSITFINNGISWSAVSFIN